VAQAVEVPGAQSRSRHCPAPQLWFAVQGVLVAALPSALQVIAVATSAQ
jgi:hypothetical protein